MALVEGTNGGFVTEAPVDDPTAETTEINDNKAIGAKFTSPATATTITEIGWWSDAVTEEANFEVGLYNDDSVNTMPNELLYSDTTNAKGTTAGWKRVTGVNWSIEPSTVY